MKPVLNTDLLSLVNWFPWVSSTSVACFFFQPPKHPSLLFFSPSCWGSFTSTVAAIIKEFRRLCLLCLLNAEVFVFQACSRSLAEWQWSKWPIRNAACHTVCRSQPHPSAVCGSSTEEPQNCGLPRFSFLYLHVSIRGGADRGQAGGNLSDCERVCTFWPQENYSACFLLNRV